MPSGLPLEAFTYFRLIERHNDTTWWHAHRERWDEHVHGPLQALADDLSPEFGDLAVSRPNRDIRLTADKSPYRRYCSLSRVSATRAGLYLQVDRRGVLVAGGLWRPTSDQLRAFRAAVDDDRTAAALDRVLGGLRRRRLPLGHDEPLARAPRGYDTAHPRIELLRRTRLTVERRWEPAEWMATGELRRRVERAWRAMTPWIEWLDREVGGGSVEHSAAESLDS